MNQLGWLIEWKERPLSPAMFYYVSDGDWCSNPNHAYRFATKEAAEIKCASFINTTGTLAVSQYMWVAPAGNNLTGEGPPC